MNKKNLFFSTILILLVQISFAQVIQEEQPSKERWNLVSSEGTVTKINKETRELTLMGPEGDLNTIKAGEQIKRFDEISVDDKISFDYWTYIKAEFREPTLAERAAPLQIISEAGKAPEGVDPGALVGAVAKAIVTIEVLNRPYMLATVRGPGGNFMTIPVQDSKILEKVRIGQEFILTYAEAIAVSLKKIDSK
ncbi:hypothetical protein [Flavicella sp.]|uniref:hypothetical protein n=1 Tax=Flavicella sp. TaxID=2957742 RepID=UPI0026132331|nr:hypothetical protein [Flavicella sp.]MDG1804204.1 hypothetical protein [Flavicella sp.]MDG2281286.1 hypothetical protein [Flavicella sp.]